MQKLLMLGTSYGTCEMLRYAKSIGVHTIVTDYNEPEHSLGKQISDEYWMINTGDLDTLEAKCREEGVNAVVCGISEFNLEMCMELCTSPAIRTTSSVSPAPSVRRCRMIIISPIPRRVRSSTQ